MAEDLAGNVERFMGFADTYDAYRPTPPAAIIDILTQLAGTAKPHLVVDLGCGTGLSSRIWADRAERVVGVEPSADMRAQAEVRSAKLISDTVFEFRDGLSTETGLPDGCADIVTCSQSLHWMEPIGTFAESARILRPGGVFAAIDCDWPPTTDVAAELAYSAASKRIGAMCRERGVTDSVRKWSKEEHLQRIRESGQFKYTKEILAHGIEQGNADRLVGLMLSQGSVQSLLKLGLSEDEIGITDLRKAAAEALGDEQSTWYFSYRVRVGVR